MSSWPTRSFFPRFSPFISTMPCIGTPWRWAMPESVSPLRTTWPAKVRRSLGCIDGQLAAKASAFCFGILSAYGRGGVQERRSSGLRSMSSRSVTPAALATTASSVAEGIFTSSYSVHECFSISSSVKPNACGCFEMIAAAMSFGT